MTRRLSLLSANLLLLTAVIVMTYANIPRAPHLCLSNLGADWQKKRIIQTHVIILSEMINPAALLENGLTEEGCSVAAFIASGPFGIEVCLYEIPER